MQLLDFYFINKDTLGCPQGVLPLSLYSYTWGVGDSLKGNGDSQGCPCQESEYMSAMSEKDSQTTCSATFVLGKKTTHLSFIMIQGPL